MTTYLDGRSGKKVKEGWGISPEEQEALDRAANLPSDAEKIATSVAESVFTSIRADLVHQEGILPHDKHLNEEEKLARLEAGIKQCRQEQSSAF